jgi:hypothetical protein
MRLHLRNPLLLVLLLLLARDGVVRRIVVLVPRLRCRLWSRLLSQ